MRTRFIILGLVLVASWLVLRPHPLTPSAQIPTFAQTQEKLGIAGPISTSALPIRVPQRVAGCFFPELPARAELVLLSASHGQAASTVTIGHQDVATTTATITVEPGERPLYVVITAIHPVVWRFTGAVERVQALVFAGGGSPFFRIGEAPQDTTNMVPLSGETGVTRSHVTFLPHRCVEVVLQAEGVEATLTKGLLKDYVGRMPDVMAAQESVSDIAIPSGVVSASDPNSTWRQLHDRPLSVLEFFGTGLENRFHPDLARLMTQRYPDGVVKIEPGTVVASDAVQPYEVLPDIAGLQQLVREGAIEDMGYDTFHIRRRIRMPAELTTGGFLLLKGVPEPSGDPGLGCVVSEETAKPIASFTTRFSC